MPKAKNNVTLNKPQKEMNKLEWLIQWFYKRWYFAIPVFLVLIVIGLGSFTDSIDSISSFCHKHFSKERPLFEKNDKRLKVLIIPFIEISQEGNLDIAYVIKKRLDSLNRVDKLNIVTHYYAERKVTQQFNEDSANFLLEHENADLIIYGDYSNQSEIGHEFSISYQTSKSLNTIEEEFKNKFGEYKTGTLHDIRNGKIQGSIEFIIYWINSISRYKTWYLSLINEPESANKEAMLYIKYLNRCIDMNQIYPKVYFNRACVLSFSLSKYDEAIKDYSKAIELDPNYFLAYTNRGIILCVIKKDCLAAINDLTKAVSLKPNLPYLYFNLGQAYSFSKNERAAIQCYTSAINLGVKDPSAFYNRGNCYISIGNLDSAIIDFGSAIYLDSSYSKAWANRAEAYYQKGMLYSSLSDYTKTIELEPNNALAYSNRGDIYQTKGNIDSAFIDYNKAISIDPKLAVAYVNRGSVYLNKNQKEEALNDFNIAISLNPNLSDAYYNRGQLFKLKGLIKEAERDFQTYNKLKDRK